jgi:hypothetical protein
VHAPADLRARVRGGMVISVLQDLNELRRSRSRASPRSEHWRPERWREVTGSRYPIVRIGEGFLAMADDDLTAKVAEIPASAVLEFAEHVATVVEWDQEASRGHGGDRRPFDERDRSQLRGSAAGGLSGTPPAATD